MELIAQDSKTDTAGAIVVQLREAGCAVFWVRVIPSVLIDQTISYMLAVGYSGAHIYIAWRISVHANFYHTMRQRGTREDVTTISCTYEKIDKRRRVWDSV
jgi:hypothetical protein